MAVACASKFSSESIWLSHYSLTHSCSTTAWEPMWSLVPCLHTYHENDLLKVDKCVAEHHIIKLSLCAGSDRGGLTKMPDSNPTAAQCVPTTHHVLATMSQANHIHCSHVAVYVPIRGARHSLSLTPTQICFISLFMLNIQLTPCVGITCR